MGDTRSLDYSSHALAWPAPVAVVVAVVLEGVVAVVGWCKTWYESQGAWAAS